MPPYIITASQSPIDVTIILFYTLGNMHCKISKNYCNFGSAALLKCKKLKAHCIHVPMANVKVKVKVTLVQALRLCTGRTAHRGSRGIALSFHDHGTRRG